MLCYINEKEGQINVEKGRRLIRGEKRLSEGKEKIKGSREKRVRGISKVFKLFGRILGRYKALASKVKRSKSWNFAIVLHHMFKDQVFPADKQVLVSRILLRTRNIFQTSEKQTPLRSLSL